VRPGAVAGGDQVDTGGVVGLYATILSCDLRDATFDAFERKGVSER
jgi:hypothetical protein